MLSLLMILQLCTSIECTEIQPVINSAFVKMLKYDGEGIPELVYCKVEKG